MRILHSIFLVIFCSGVCITHSFANGGDFGQNPGLDFYSKIDASSNAIIDGLVKQRIRAYRTYGGLNRVGCRTGAPWLDSMPIDEALLQEATQGVYTRLLLLAQSKKVSLSSDSLIALATCMADAYHTMQTDAMRQSSALERVGSLGLYTDGDTSNSDYDILDDIEKINVILFKDPINYKGTKNMGRTSLSDLLSGKAIKSLFSDEGDTSRDDSSLGVNTGNSADTTGSESSEATLSDLGIGSVCRTDTASVTSVDNLVDATFLRELSDTLTLGNDAVSNIGGSYGPSSGNEDAVETGATSESDFYHQIPCNNIFCIKVQMIGGSKNLLGSGKGKESIEGILERHISIMRPIANSNLGCNHMTKDFFDSTQSSGNFPVDQLKKQPIQMGEAMAPTRRDKKDDTPAAKDARLQAAYKCAMYSAGLPENQNTANSALGAVYAPRNGSTSENIAKSTTIVGPFDPKQQELAGCFDVALSAGRLSYYNSISTDLTELAALTAGISNEVMSILSTGFFLDNRGYCP